MKNICHRTCLVFALAAILTGACQSGNKAGEAGADKKAEDKSIEIVYVEWSDAVASTNVVKAVLEDMGYKVDTIPVSAAAMWQSTATGDSDAFVAAWLPTTHAHYLKAVKDKVELLGPNLEGTRIGLVVPAYVNMSSIEDLPTNAEKFNSRIIGIDPGAGLMSKTEKAIDEYGLSGIELVEGSDATMVGALQSAIKKEQWIVVTGWTPHWKFARWDLKFLDDPKGVYGGDGNIGTVVRLGLKEDMPDAYYLLDHFKWDSSELEKVMSWNREKGTTPAENARRWIAENPETVSSWKPVSHRQ